MTTPFTKRNRPVAGASFSQSPEMVPALAFEVGFILMADEPEQDIHGIVIPGRSRTHSNFTQRSECFTLVALLVVFVL